MFKKGYYYHYKHSDKKSVGDHAYEVMGTALDTEGTNVSVIYRPLYKNKFIEGRDFFSRPYKMFMEKVKVGEIMVKRFSIITDEKTLTKLKKIRDSMYL